MPGKECAMYLKIWRCNTIIYRMSGEKISVNKAINISKQSIKLY
jgi:hypothetical protein